MAENDGRKGAHRETSRARNIQPSLGYNESLDETVRWPSRVLSLFLDTLFVSRLLFRALLVPKKRRTVEARRPRTGFARIMYENRLFISFCGAVRRRQAELRPGKREEQIQTRRKGCRKVYLVPRNEKKIRRRRIFFNHITVTHT